MEVSVVIPNYNGKRLLEKQLPVLTKIKEIKNIIIVDDASTDESVNFLKKNFPKIILIEKVHNDGFAMTVNIGVKAVDTELFVLLNSDVLPELDFLDALLPHFKDPKVTAVGCLDESHEDGKTIERGRGVGSFEKGLLMHSRGETDQSNTLWVSGGSSMYRTSVWRKIHGMNTLYSPFYWEDIDYSYRVQKQGYKIAFEPKSRIKHLHQQGAILTHYKSHQIKEIAYRNQILFVWLNITDRKLIANHIAWLPYHIVTAIWRGDFGFVRGLLFAVRMFPKVLHVRRSSLQNEKIKDNVILNSVKS